MVCAPFDPGNAQGCNMQLRELEIPGVYVLTPRRFADDRGWFSESYNQRTLATSGVDLTFVQDNHSYSKYPGTIRGFHFQSPPHAQDKLVRCVRGSIIDIAVDIRAGSPTYAKWVAVTLSGENGDQLFVPVGFAHAFVTLEPDTEVLYKVTEFYSPESDAGIRWDDSTIAFPWKLPLGAPHLSAKDATLPFLQDIRTIFQFSPRVA